MSIFPKKERVSFCVIFDLGNLLIWYLEQYQKVIGVFFNYIQLMKENGIQEELFNDIQSMSSTIFRYQDNGSASDTTAFYSKLLKFDYPPHRVLSGSLIPLEYDPELIYEHLGAIRTDNFSLFLACDNPPNGISFMECERWFGAEYNVLDFDESFIQVSLEINTNTSDLLLIPLV